MVPDLPAKDITSYFAGVDIEIAPSDLLRPTILSTQRIYESILTLLDGTQENQIQADESIQTIRLVQRMGMFLARIGINNFTVRDLVPESRRIIQILSTIINFCMYRDTKQHIYERVSRIADDNFAEKTKLKENMKKINEEIKSGKERLKDEETRIKEMENEINKLEKELKELYRHQKDKASEVALLKAEKTEINDKLCSCQLLEHNLQQEIVCLKAQIVSDPGKLIELVKEMRELIEKERETIHNTERTTLERRTRLQKAERINEIVRKMYAICVELQDLDEKTAHIDQAGILQESKLKNQESAINAVKIRIGHVERQISHLESKIFNLQAKDKEYSEEITGKMSKLKIKYDGMSDERERMMDGVRENNRKIQEVLHKQMIIKNEFDRECAGIISELVNLSGDITKYFSEIFSEF